MIDPAASMTQEIPAQDGARRRIAALLDLHRDAALSKARRANCSYEEHAAQTNRS
jgi:hypothetical protein